MQHPMDKCHGNYWNMTAVVEITLLAKQAATLSSLPLVSSSSQQLFFSPSSGFLPSRKGNKCSSRNNHVPLHCCWAAFSGCIDDSGRGVGTGSQIFAAITAISVIRSSNTDGPFLALCVGSIPFLACSRIVVPWQGLPTFPGHSQALEEMNVLPQNPSSDLQSSPALFDLTSCRPWLQRTKQHPECGGSLQPVCIPSTDQQGRLL